MKKMMTLMAMLAIAATVMAKDIKTVVFTTLPQMQCENCENKIKGNMKFEKGVKEVETNIAEQKVTIKYDADKTTPEKLAEGFAKFNYKATVVSDDAPAKKGGCCSEKKDDAAKKEGGCCSEKKEAPAKKEGGCCSEKKDDADKAGGCCSEKKEAPAKKEGGCQGSCCKK